jgi:hypothetical protein
MRSSLFASIELKDGGKVNKGGSIVRRWRDGVLDTATNGIPRQVTYYPIDYFFTSDSEGTTSCSYDDVPRVPRHDQRQWQ